MKTNIGKVEIWEANQYGIDNANRLLLRCGNGYRNRIALVDEELAGEIFGDFGRAEVNHLKYQLVVAGELVAGIVVRC